MADISFTRLIAITHLCHKAGLRAPATDNFEVLETGWLSIYELGRLELYGYLYNECRQAEDFEEWLLKIKGPDALMKADRDFALWRKGSLSTAPAGPVAHELLDASMLQHWKEQGYLKISSLVAPELCDAVKRFICAYQGIDLSDRQTWYPNNEDWHGLMLQVFQHPDIAAIRSHPAIRQLFAELYQTRDIKANTEKVSYNPPETDSWKFRHSLLHWDIDMHQPRSFYIQGLVYLDDAPEDRGPLKVVPGFHHKYDDYIRQFNSTDEAQESIRDHPAAIAVPGKKGDIVLWEQTLPHAASPNHSPLPRFVQYISFTKL